MKRWLQDLSLSTAVAGFVAVLVGFTSSVAIVFQAAQALGATPAQTSSWIWALGLGMGLTSLGLSLWTRQPSARMCTTRLSNSFQSSATRPDSLFGRPRRSSPRRTLLIC